MRTQQATCDLCRELADDPFTIKVEQDMSIGPPRKISVRSAYPTWELDMCSDCMGKFRLWLERMR